MRAKLRWFALPCAALLMAVSAPAALGDDAGVFTNPASPLFPRSGTSPGTAASPSDASDRAAERARWEQERQSPAAKERRQNSRNAFRNKGRGEAAQIARNSFSEVTERAWRSLTLSENERIVDFRGPFGAVVKRQEKDGGTDSYYVESLLPLRSSIESGQPELAKLDLEEQGSEYVPQNPLVPVAISKDVAEGVSFPGGLRAQAEERSDTPSVVGDRAFFANVQEDADLIVSPSQLGAQFAWQLRSPASPEDYRLRFNLPEGARLRPEPKTRGVELVGADGRTIAFVNPPLAHDAAGEPVAAAYDVDGSALVVKVDHRSEDLQYPIHLDPLVDSFNYVNPAQPGGCSAWQQSGWFGVSTGSVAIGEFSCPSRPTALWILANPGPGQGEWHFRAPRQSYLTRVDFGVNHYPNTSFGSKIEEGVWSNQYGNWEAGHWGHGGSSPGCASGFLPTTPPDFSSPWIGTVYRNASDQFNSCYRGSPYNALTNNGKVHVFDDANQHPGNEARFHLQVYGATNANAAHLVGANLSLDDNDFPRLTWEQINPHTGWLAAGLGIEHHVTAQDPGLGMKSITQSVEGAQSSTVNAAPCASGRISACPEFETRAATYNTNSIPEGYRTLNVTTTDVLGKSSTASKTIKVDKSGPTIATPTGALYDKRNQTSDHRNEGIYDAQSSLSVTASEGSDASNATKRSGVKSIEVLMKPASSPVSAFSQKASKENTCTPPVAGQCPYSFSTPLSWTFNADSVADGDYTIRVLAKDLIGNFSTTDWTVTVDRRGSIHRAEEVTGNPATGGERFTEEWGEYGTQHGRSEETSEDQAVSGIATIDSVSCEDQGPGARCDEVRMRDFKEPGNPDPKEGYLVYRGSKEDDPHLPRVVGILEPPEDRAPDATGALISALQPWQRPPADRGTTYARYDRVKSEADVTQRDDGTETTENYEVVVRTWFDQKTKMPLKEEVTRRANSSDPGNVVATVFWTYRTARLERSELAADFFSVGKSADTGKEERAKYRGAASLGRPTDVQSGVTFTPYGLGVQPVLLQGTFCLASAAIADFISSYPANFPSPDPAEPVTSTTPAETYSSVDYVESPLNICTVGQMPFDTSDLSVQSFARNSGASSEWRQVYRQQAEAIQADASHPQRSRAGVVPSVIVGTQTTTAYVIPLDSERTSALMDLGDSTVILHGSFNRTDLQAVASKLQPR